MVKLAIFQQQWEEQTCQALGWGCGHWVERGEWAEGQGLKVEGEAREHHW